MSDADRDTPATTEPDIWREAADRLKLATQAEGGNRQNGLEALRFVWGDQWDDDVTNTRKIEGRPALTVNHTAVFVNRLKNTLRQQRPRIKAHPVGQGANIDTANVVNGLLRHIEDISYASVAYDRGAACAVAAGWGYWRIVGEYIDERSFDQELKILSIRNAFTVYDDPSSEHPAGLDRTWLIISTMMKRAEYKRRYPKAPNVEWRYSEAPGDGTTEWESKEDIRLAEYFRICEYKDELCQMTDGSLKLRSEIKRIDGDVREAVQYEVAKDPAGKEITRPTTRRCVEWFRLNGKEVVERKELRGKYIPVIRCEGQVEDIDGKVLRKGMVADLMDPARIFNYTETQKTERYALTPKAPWTAYEGVIDGHPEWNDANQKSYSVLVGKAVLGPDGATLLPLPQRTPPPPVEAGMAEWSSSAERNLMAVAGMAPENPEITRRVVGGDKYLQRRQGMQDLTHFQYYDNQTLSIAATGVILLDLIPYYYDTKRMQRIIGEDGVPEMVTLNEPQEVSPGVKVVKNDMQVGRYAVVMDTGPGYATQQEENAENMVNLLGTPLGEVIVKTGSDIVLRNFNFPGAQDLADRAMVTNPEAMDKAVKNLPKQAQTIIGAMTKAMQEKDQQIQNLSLELKYKATVEGAKVEERRESNVRDNETRRAIAGAGNVVDLHVEDSKAATSRDVAEIHGATQLLNTRAESIHEEKQADKLIKAGTEDRKPTGE